MSELTDHYLINCEIMLVYLTDSPEVFSGGIAIRKPKFTKLFDKIFIVGEVPLNSNDWASGLQTAISFDQVSHFLEFPNENEYIKRLSFTNLSKDVMS